MKSKFQTEMETGIDLRARCRINHQNNTIRPQGEWERRVRVAVFGSFLGGHCLLNELLIGEIACRVQVVGVATDDPTQPYTNAKKRLWQYPHTLDDETLVERFAASHDLPVFKGRVKSDSFREKFASDWKPDMVLMATFGQKIPNCLIEFPRLGFFNFHHSGPQWPSYPGPNPIADMVRDGRKHLVLTMHEVSDVIDNGEFVARSHTVGIPHGVNAMEMHRISWPQMGSFVRRAVGRLLNADMPRNDICAINETPAPWGSGEVCRPHRRARSPSDDYMAALRASR